MRTARFTTLALALLAAAPAAVAVERADTVATYVGGGSEHHPISGDGRRVAFVEFTVGGDYEISIWEHESGSTQITDEANKPGPNAVGALDVDFDGTAVAAIALGDLADTGAVIPELYRWTEASGWQRLTFTSGSVPKVFTFDAAISEDGTRIAFASSDDYTGENPGGEQQVFLWDEGAGFTQVTHGFPCGPNGANFLRDMGGDGSRVLFSSRCRYGAANDDLGLDLFLWDETTGVVALTETKPGDAVVRASLDRDGTVAAVVSNRDLTGESISGHRLYRWVDGGGFTLLSKQEPASPATPSISANGDRIVYVAPNGQGSAEINPENAPELFFWQQGLPDVAALTDSGQTDQGLGNDLPRLAADGTRLAMVAQREFDAPADVRTGHYVIDVLSPQQARPNLLANGSFDTGLGGWRLGLSAVYSPADGKADPASGSALQPNTQAGGGGAVSAIAQCVPVAPATAYVVSGLLRIVPGNNTGSARLGVHLHPTKTCSGGGFTPLGPAQITRDDGAWIGAHGRFVTGPTTKAVDVVLFAGKNEPGGALEAGFDDVSLRRDNKIKILP
jgi:hypothetical protein